MPTPSFDFDVITGPSTPRGEYAAPQPVPAPPPAQTAPAPQRQS